MEVATLSFKQLFFTCTIIFLNQLFHLFFYLSLRLCMHCQKFEKMFVFDEICGANLQEHVFSSSIFFLA